MSLPDGRANGKRRRSGLPPGPAQGLDRPSREPPSWGWSANRLTVLGSVLCAVVAVLDVLVGDGGILAGLLIVGPCCGVLTGRWSRAALLGTWAVVLAIVLGFAGGPWASVAHLAFLAAVVVVGLVSTLSAAIIEWSIRRR
jgi:hypothetical protein